MTNPKVGDAVQYVDPLGKAHPALVTAVWPSYGKEPFNSPGLNVVFVVDDENKSDTYGRQIERDTSVLHASVQPAHGRCWRAVDEVN